MITQQGGLSSQGALEPTHQMRVPWVPLSGWGKQPRLSALEGGASQYLHPVMVGFKLGSSQKSLRPGLEGRGRQEGEEDGTSQHHEVPGLVTCSANVRMV